MKQTSKKRFSFFLFVLAATLWSGVFFVLPEFVDNPSNGFNGFIIIAFHWCLVLFATFFLLYAAAANKYVFAVFFPFFSLLGAVLAFYRYAYKATLTPMLIDASLHNDLGTTLDLISPELIVYVLLCVIISVFFVCFRFKKVVPDKWWLHFFVAIISLGVFFNLNNRVKTSIFQRFPFSVYFNVSEYNKLHLKTPRERISPESVLNEQFTDSLTVVFVLGDVLRQT
jgi:glucan phosphoethanolaminetransferase (alkaline phosphatase superfamily)